MQKGSFLNDKSITHTFQIEMLEESKYIRIRSIEHNWCNNFYFGIESFEIYGKLYSVA